MEWATQSLVGYSPPFLSCFYPVHEPEWLVFPRVGSCAWLGWEPAGDARSELVCPIYRQKVSRKQKEQAYQTNYLCIIIWLYLSYLFGEGARMTVLGSAPRPACPPYLFISAHTAPISQGPPDSLPPPIGSSSTGSGWEPPKQNKTKTISIQRANQQPNHMDGMASVISKRTRNRSLILSDPPD